MELLNDGLRSIARNFGVVMLGAVLVVLTSGAYAFANAWSLKNLYPELLAAAAAINASADTAPQEPETPKADGNLTIQDSGSYTTDQAGQTVEITTSSRPGPPPMTYGITVLFLKLLYGIAIACIYASIFAALGKAIDRPLWKCDVPGEALRRFFMPWFILTLLLLLLGNVQANTQSEDVYFSIEILLFFFTPFVVAIGACVMHHGALDWERLGDILSPIGRQFRLFIPVLWLALLQYWIQQVIAQLLPRGPESLYLRAASATAMDVPIWLMDALIFCMMWRICMLDRDAVPAEPADFD